MPYEAFQGKMRERKVGVEMTLLKNQKEVNSGNHNN
jgi:hypothetical protein